MGSLAVSFKSCYSFHEELLGNFFLFQDIQAFLINDFSSSIRYGEF